MDFNKDYRLATEDEDYPQGFSDAPEDDEEEEEDYHEEEDYYDFPEDDGPWYDPQDGKYL